MAHLLDSASVFCKANAEGEKWEKANPDPDTTDLNLQVPNSIQGEHIPNNDEMCSRGTTICARNTSSRQTPLITKQVPPESTALVVHASKEKDSEEKMKRLADLKAKQEKTEQKLKALSNEELEAQAAQLASFEAKRKRMLEEYNHYITYRANKLPIIKISYKIDKAKFEWIKTQAGKLGIPPPPKLTAFRLFAAEKKRKRSLEIIKEVFVKEDIVMDGMHRNLIPPPGRGTPEVEEMFKKIELTIEARNDVTEARRIESAGIEGLIECKVLANNLRRIQVKDIVKEVKDYLKTYSSAGMDISWYVERIYCGSKESQRLLIQSEGLHKFACKLDTYSSLLVQRVLSFASFNFVTFYPDLTNISLGHSDKIKIPNAEPVDHVVEVFMLLKFDMHLYTSSMDEIHVNWYIKSYNILIDLHPCVAPTGMTMDQLPDDAIGLYLHHFQQGGLRVPFLQSFSE
ncbi:hypothetical protein Tco_0579404 [Tanacetum coccineum]